MSVCDPKNPCEKCQGEGHRFVRLAPRIGGGDSIPPQHRKKDELKELEELLAEMRTIRNDARRLTRSGNPAVSGQALKYMAQAEDNIRWIHHQMREAK